MIGNNWVIKTTEGIFWNKYFEWKKLINTAAAKKKKIVLAFVFCAMADWRCKRQITKPMLQMSQLELKTKPIIWLVFFQFDDAYLLLLLLLFSWL